MGCSKLATNQFVTKLYLEKTIFDLINSYKTYNFCSCDYFFKNNIRDTTYFTTKLLQTDVAS
jgi:hypothetical protein